MRSEEEGGRGKVYRPKFCGGLGDWKDGIMEGWKDGARRKKEKG